ncbi:uncharacterized protein LOC105200645 isoform X2 [Solenopsis invicta]|uniref:uncharacterized protein LOC105200645 isoform X2 n=1 Tax=Solenopsis invicta TaxID=13686 RepID=UPI00193CD8EC|nr:uncharacterized protein LOC105200645 isoform X2 [Solenopsis invicta]
MNKGFRLAEKLGKVTTNPKVAYEFLKIIDAKKLIETQEKFLLTKTEIQQHCSMVKMGLRFTPTSDNESSKPVFPGDLKKFMNRGVKVPLLIGFTNCEGSFIVSSNICGCACHGEELPYLFHFSKRKNLGISLPAVDSKDGKMIHHLTQMWTDFAKTGNPTSTTNAWLPVTGSQGQNNYINIDVNSQMNVFRKGEESWNWEEKKHKLRR